MFKLKLITTVAFIFGIALLLSWLFILGPKPVHASPKELANYAVRSLVYFCLTAFSFLCSSFGAWLIIKKQREEFAIAHLEMMKSLVDGSLNDHARPQSTETRKEL